MPEPLARDEDRRPHVEAEGVVLERRPVPVAHEKADQALVGLVHLLLTTGEADARGVGDGKVGGHRDVEPDEAVVEDPNRVLRYDSVGRGHWGSERNDALGEPALRVAGAIRVVAARRDAAPDRRLRE